MDEAGNRVLVITNFTPVPQQAFRLGVPKTGKYRLLLNTDAKQYNGSDYPVLQDVSTEAISSEGLDQSLLLSVPPLATLFYQWSAK